MTGSGTSGISGVIAVIQILFVIVVGLYFGISWSQHGNRVAVDRESKKEMEKIQQLRRISLAEPLSEKTRPQRFDEIVGQEEGTQSLAGSPFGAQPPACSD